MVRGLSKGIQAQKGRYIHFRDRDASDCCSVFFSGPTSQPNRKCFGPRDPGKFKFANQWLVANFRNSSYLWQKLCGGQRTARFDLRKDVSDVRHETQHIDTGSANPSERLNNTRQARLSDICMILQVGGTARSARRQFEHTRTSVHYENDQEDGVKPLRYKPLF